jgi:hypothetical protein
MIELIVPLIFAVFGAVLALILGVILIQEGLAGWRWLRGQEKRELLEAIDRGDDWPPATVHPIRMARTRREEERAASRSLYPDSRREVQAAPRRAPAHVEAPATFERPGA